MASKPPKNWHWETGLETLEWQAVPARGNVNEHDRGKILGALVHLGDLGSGVEPKFLAYVRDEKYNEVVKNIILKHLQTNDKNNPIILFLKTLPKRPKTAMRVIRNCRDLSTLELFEKIQNDLPSMQLILDDLKKLPVLQQPKKYLVKQDYKDPARPGISNKVSISKRRAMFVSRSKKLVKQGKLGLGVAKVYAFFYNIARLRKKRTENRNALLECLATRVARSTGMDTQEQGIIFGTYKDGHPKIMTMTSWKDGFNDFEDKLAGGSIKYGNYFVETVVKLERDGEGNEKRKILPKKHPDGYFHANDSVKDLGENLALIIRQGDYDVVGSKGGNKGFIGSKLFGIDFGHAYREENPIVSVGKLQDDFSFDFEKVPNTFKNITVFYDNPLSEKMKGIYYLVKQRTGQNPSKEIMEAYGPEFRDKINRIQKDSDIKIFDAFIETAKKLEKKDEEGYQRLARKIERCKERALSADKKILAIFQKRIGLTPRELNFLDSLEKLLSPTSNLSPGKKSFISKLLSREPTGQVKLNHLRVLPGKRVACELELDKRSNRYKIKIAVSNKEQAEELKEKLLNFDKKAFSEFGLNFKFNEESSDKKYLEIDCNQEQLQMLIRDINEDRVAAHKKQPTLTSERNFGNVRHDLLFQGVENHEKQDREEKIRSGIQEDLNADSLQKTTIPKPYQSKVELLVKESIEAINQNADSIFSKKYPNVKVTYQKNSVTACDFSGNRVVEAASDFYKQLNQTVSTQAALRTSGISIKPPSYTLRVSSTLSNERIKELLEKAENSDPKIVITRIKIGSNEPEMVQDFTNRIRLNSPKPY